MQDGTPKAGALLGACLLSDASSGRRRHLALRCPRRHRGMTMTHESHNVTYIAQANYRAQLRPFGIKQKDRFSHTYIVGKTGTGKSTLIKNMLLQDIRGGNGCALFDPHGDLVEEVLEVAQLERPGDLTYLDATKARPTWRFNPLGGVQPQQRPLAVAGLIDVFRKTWGEDAVGVRTEHVLRNAAFTLLESTEGSLASVPRLLTDPTYRRSLLEGVQNQRVLQFWSAEYDRYSPGMRSVVIAPLLNKVGALLTDPRLNRILGSTTSSFRLSEVMDSGSVLLVNLAKGRIGEGPSALLGSLLVSYLSLAGLGRAQQPEEERRSFFVFLDEFQQLSTSALVTMLPELRKFKIGLVLANQHLSQLSPELRDSVLGNTGTLVSFRVGAGDAALIARELSPTFRADDLIGLPNFQVYLKLLIDGQPSKPFSARAFSG